LNPRSNANHYTTDAVYLLNFTYLFNITTTIPLSGRCKATHSKPLTQEESILSEPSGINLLKIANLQHDTHNQ